MLGVDSFLFALGTEVVVGALRALVADTSDGRCFAAIAGDTFMRLDLRLVLVISLHEVFVAHQLDLLDSLLNHITHILKAELSSLLALTTRFTFLVEFCALALEAGHVVSIAFLWDSALFTWLTFLVDLSTLALGAFSYTFLFGRQF